MDGQKLYRIQDLEAMGIGDRITQYRARLAGKLNYYKLGTSIRYSEKHVQDYLARHEKTGKNAKQKQAA